MKPLVAPIQLITTRAHYTVKTFMARQDTLGLVLSGEKRLLQPHGEQSFSSGDLFVLERSAQIDVVNQPERGGYYRAQLIQFSPELIDFFQTMYPHLARSCVGDRLPTLNPHPLLLDAFRRSAARLENAPCSAELQHHWALEMLLLLAERGIYFAGSQSLNWSDRVYRLMKGTPHSKWNLSSVAQHLLLSKSTLQRRLSSEGTSLSECLSQVRLDTALDLLQGTNNQIADIASRCGYESHSRFGAAFKKRFGLSPSKIRLVAC